MVARYPRIGQPPRFSRLRFTVTLVLCTLVVLLSITTWWAERQLSGPLLEIARLRATNVASAAINRAVGDVVAHRIDGLSLFEFTAGPGDRPVIAYHMGRINQVIAEAVAAILEALGDKQPEEFTVPLGELSGMRILAGWGPMLPVRIMVGGAVKAEPKVSFVSAGINQVAHRIYLDLEVQMTVVAPLVREPIIVRQPVILSEKLLPGDVPNTYLQFLGYSGSLEEWMALQTALSQH